MMGLPAYEKRAIYEFIGLLLEQHFTVANMEMLVQKVDARMHDKEISIWKGKVGLESYVINVFERISGIPMKINREKIETSKKEKQENNITDDEQFGQAAKRAVDFAFTRMRKRLPEGVWAEHAQDMKQEAYARIAKAKGRISVKDNNIKKIRCFIERHAYGAMLDYARGYLTDNQSRKDYQGAKKAGDVGKLSYMYTVLSKLDIGDYAEVISGGVSGIDLADDNMICNRLKETITKILTEECSYPLQERAFAMKFFDDKTHAEIALELSRSESTISCYISSALSILKRHKPELRGMIVQLCDGESLKGKELG